MNGSRRVTARNRIAILLPIPLVFLVAASIVWIGWRLVGEDAFQRQVVVWVANVAMLLTIYTGLRTRRQTWADLGLGCRAVGARVLLRVALQSVGVLVFALAAFVSGSVLAAQFAPTTASADMGGYEYLQGNLPMLFLALAAVYVVSSFGEEVVYRGFLVSRLDELGGGTRVSAFAAVVISAIVFGLAHFDWGIVGIIQTTMMGLALAVSYLLVKRNLWVLVLAHACIDTMLLLQLYFGSGTTDG